MPTGLVIPSYVNGFARRDGPPANPGLWKGLVDLYHAPLGRGPDGGLTWRDESGRHNHGTFVGGPTWEIGTLGHGVAFDDSAERVSIPDPAIDGSVTGKWSCAVWADNIAPVGSDFISLCGRSSNRSSLFGFRQNGSVRIFFDDSGNVSWGVSVGGLHHGVTVRNGGSAELFWDGKSQGTKVTNDPSDTIDFAGIATIGRNNFPTGHVRTHSVAVWNRILAPSEIQTLYRDPHALTRLEELPAVKAPAAPAAPGTDRPFHPNVFAAPFGQAM